MNAPNDMSNYPYEQPFSFASWLNGWIVKIKKVISANFKIVLMVVCVGAALGLAYSIFKPVRYNAEITFSVEDSKSIGGGLLSSLGGSIGMDIGSLAGSGNSVLSGDNVLSLLKSKSMMAQCLKTPYPIENNTNNTIATKNTPVDIILLGTDPLNGSLSYSLGSATSGTISILNNVVTYTPDVDFTGEASFGFSVNNGVMDSDEFYVYITVGE